ncbi:MAG TPA: aminotransferase class V-fold PLP-dependent enzyme, partial [Candidatus Dependentiae bacterium]|nr:aminotransferase class V-fold PLP-dependent enzyme [Candidatus Dependentiae bacterium]
CAQPLAKKLGYHASLRASFYFYNTMQEVDRLIDAVGELSYYFK